MTGDDATRDDATRDDEPADPVMFDHYMAAIAEIFELRAVLAHEADQIESHLQLRTFPASRRSIAETQVLRMRAVLRRPAKLVYGDRPFRYAALRRLGLAILTRAMWEQREQLPKASPFDHPGRMFPGFRRANDGRRWIAT